VKKKLMPEEVLASATIRGEAHNIKPTIKQSIKRINAPLSFNKEMNYTIGLSLYCAITLSLGKDSTCSINLLIDLDFNWSLRFMTLCFMI
jgi:hypothetical protein